MDIEVAKVLAAALALFPMGMVGLALGKIFSSYNESIARNPNSADELNKKYVLSFAFTEALGIFAFVTALIIIFG